MYIVEDSKMFFMSKLDAPGSTLDNATILLDNSHRLDFSVKTHSLNILYESHLNSLKSIKIAEGYNVHVAGELNITSLKLSTDSKLSILGNLKVEELILEGSSSIRIEGAVEIGTLYKWEGAKFEVDGTCEIDLECSIIPPEDTGTDSSFTVVGTFTHEEEVAELSLTGDAAD